MDTPEWKHKTNRIDGAESEGKENVFRALFFLNALEAAMQVCGENFTRACGRQSHKALKTNHSPSLAFNFVQQLSLGHRPNATLLSRWQVCLFPSEVNF